MKSHLAVTGTNDRDLGCRMASQTDICEHSWAVSNEALSSSSISRLSITIKN